MEIWKRFFVKMVEGKIPYNHKFYVVSDDANNDKSDSGSKDIPPLNLISSTEEAVAIAKSELSDLPIRERESENVLNKSVLHSKRKPPGKRKISAASAGNSKSKRKKTIW